MFKNLFSKKDDGSKTGIYRIDGKSLIELEEIPGNGSINSIIEDFGYPINLVHTVLTFNSNKINCLGFKTLSKDLVFVLANNREKLSFSDVAKEINAVDWDFEYSSLNVEDILADGVEAKNMSLDFLKSVIYDLTLEKDNIYQSEKLELLFDFENNILKAFTSSGWDNSPTKWLKNINAPMFERMLEEASIYHGNELDAMIEVNKQCECILNIPNAVNNEFVGLHTNENGNVNFFNLHIAHYTQNCELREFLFMNKGRCTKTGTKSYIVGKIIYEFGDTGQLASVYKK